MNNLSSYSGLVDAKKKSFWQRFTCNTKNLVPQRNVFFWILQEGYSDGGIVVEDCLKLMLNLLRNNSSNQTFFREGSYIQRISPFFDLGTIHILRKHLYLEHKT